MKGLVSSGSTETTKAGVFALKEGGNAIDAAIAAQLAAFVAEPLLTGFAGAGIASMRLDGELQIIDMFSTMPGMGSEKNEPSFTAVDIDFGPTTQRFFVGLGSVATPTLPQGLSYLHTNFARLPLETLIKPALQIARDGFLVSKGLETVVTLLYPIVQRSPVMRRWFSRENRPIRVGEMCHIPEIEKDLHTFAQYGKDFFLAPRYQQALKEITQKSLLSFSDIEQYAPILRKPRAKDFLSRTVQLCTEPSIGGRMLGDLLEPFPSIPKDPFGFEAVQQLEIRLRTVFDKQKRYSQQTLLTLTEQFVPNSSGFTTHLSVVDTEGNAIGITSSLGESAGAVLDNSGIILNNFLGEADVAPPIARTTSGRRLLTMCAPTLVTTENSEDIAVFGSGGSNRIASAILQGILYAEGYRFSIADAVSAPRLHVTNDLLQVETFGRTRQTLEKLQKQYGERFRSFPEPNMFFGGLHVAALENGALQGAGDLRRSGVVGFV